LRLAHAAEAAYRLRQRRGPAGGQRGPEVPEELIAPGEARVPRRQLLDLRRVGPDVRRAPEAALHRIDLADRAADALRDLGERLALVEVARDRPRPPGQRREPRERRLLPGAGPQD